MLSDLRLALRGFAKARTFTVIAVLTLAVGVGATTAMFGALRSLVVEPFSYPHADQLVMLWSNDGQPLSSPDFLDIRDQATSYAALGVYSPQPANIGGDHPQSVTSVVCTAGVLRAFGVEPALGRWLTDADDVKGAAPVAVLGNALWRLSFGADPGIIGRRVRINGSEVTIVGVMPRDFEFTSPWLRTETCQVWLPLTLNPDESSRDSHWLCGIGRLKDGVTPGAADAEIKAIGARLKAAHPATNSRKPFLVRTLHVEMTRFVGSRVWMLFGSVVLVLLVACANVASMMLARNAKRQGEFGVRVALGATRAHIVRLALVESLLLAAAGTVVGLLLAVLGVDVLRSIAPVSDARKAAMGIDGTVVAFSAGLALVATLLAGVPPALSALRVSVNDLLRTEGRGAAGSHGRHRLLRGLIIAQIAIAFILANGAGLFSASYVKLLKANESLATDRALSAEVNLRGERYKTKEQRQRFCELLAEQASALPGVTAAGTTTKLPLEGGSNMDILVNAETFDPLAERTLAEVSSVTPGYFAAAGIALLRGRTLGPQDVGEKEIGVVVNRALADKCWPGQDPLGKELRPNAASPWFKAHVVGVVENVRQWGPETEPRPEIYWTPDRAWGQVVFLVVRSPQPASRLTGALREVMKRLDPDLPLSHARTLQGVVDDAMQGQRAITGLVDFFMVAALALVGVGLYGTLSYHVLQRTREIGVRMALGAGRSSILSMVFGQGATWVGVGVVLGLAGALGLARLLQAMIYGVDPMNPASLAVSAATILAAAALACWLPAMKASRVDPVVALRAD